MKRFPPQLLVGWVVYTLKYRLSPKATAFESKSTCFNKIQWLSASNNIVLEVVALLATVCDVEPGSWC